MLVRFLTSRLSSVVHRVGDVRAVKRSVVLGAARIQRLCSSPLDTLADYLDREDIMATGQYSKLEADQLEDEDVLFDREIPLDDRKNETRPTSTDLADVKKQTRRILKNLLVITLVFLLVFLAYNGLASLQSSLHRQHGLGTMTQSITYISYFLSSLLLPRLFIVKLGQKWTIIICSLGYMTWMAANGYAVWLTLAPTSAIVGLCAGPLWTAQSSYITKYAGLYAKLKGEEPQHVIARFFGIFGALFSISKVISSIIGAVILTPHPADNTTLFVASVEDLKYCGANDCPGARNLSLNHNLDPVAPAVLWTLVAVYLICATVGVILAYFLLDPVPDDLQDKVKDKSTVWRETAELATATLRMNLKLEQALLIPFTMVPGLDFAFYFADWPLSYVTCALGISYVGWTTFPQGFLSSFSAYIGGLLTKVTGRIPLIATGMVMLCSCNIIQLYWDPHPDHMFMFYLVSIVYGMSGLGGPAKDALLGTEFKDDMDATFSNMHMWGSLGGTIAFAYSSVLCTRTKLYIIFSLMLVATLGYVLAEWRFSVKRRQSLVQQGSAEEVPLFGENEDEEETESSPQADLASENEMEPWNVNDEWSTT